jgi:O-Antigen ligase
LVLAGQQKKTYTLNGSYAFLWYVPVVAILAVTPLIVYLSVRPVPRAFREFWVSDFNSDFFSFCKVRWFIFWSVVLLLSFLFCLYKRKDEYLSFVRETKYFWMVWIVFTFSILLSAVFSPVTTFAWGGMFDRYEGCWVWLAYCLLLAACAFLPRRDTDFRYFTGAIIFSTTVIALIGALQFFGMDIFRSDFGLWLVLPQKFITADLNFAFDKGTIYSTFYNTNYGGNIAGIALPLAVCLCLFAPSFKKSGVLFLSYTLLIFVLAIGCRSQSGAFGLFVVFTFLIIYLARHYRSKIIRLVFIFALFTPIYLWMDRYAGGDISLHFTSRFLGDSGVLSFGNTLLIFFLANCKSHAGTIGLFIAFIFPIIYLAQRYRSKIKWMVLIFALFIPIYFGMDIYVGGPISGKFTDIFLGDKSVDQPSVGASLMQAKNKTFFDEMIIKYGHYAGSRFYIYLRAMEQRLKSRFLLGTGPDTFAIFFPQDDVYRTSHGGVPKTELVDKMHSMFLQIWFNTGFISFAAFMLMLLLHLVNSVQIFWKLRTQTYIEVLGLGFFLGWVGFLGAALFNDSAISISPYFWAVFGASIAANHVIISPKPLLAGGSAPVTKSPC